MGLRNMRAICPNCGAKIHTQPKGLGHFTWMNSGALAQTGTECPNCGVALSGKVGIDNKAVLAEDAGKSFFQRNAGEPSNRGGEMKAAIEQAAASRCLALCPKDRMAIEPINPEIVEKRGRLELHGLCPECGEPVKWRMPKGTTRDEIDRALA